MFYLLCISAQDIWTKFYGDISRPDEQKCPSSSIDQENGNYLFYQCNFEKSTSINIGKQVYKSDDNGYNNILFAFCKFGSVDPIHLSGNSSIITNCCITNADNDDGIFNLKSNSIQFIDSYIFNAKSSILSNHDTPLEKQHAIVQNINVSKCFPRKDQSVIFYSQNLIMKYSVLLNMSSTISIRALKHLELISSSFLDIQASFIFGESYSLTLFRCNFIYIKSYRYVFDPTEIPKVVDCYFRNLSYDWRQFKNIVDNFEGNELYNTFNIMNSQICEIQYKDNGEQVGYDGKPVIIPKPKAEPTDMAVYMNLKRGYVHQRQIIV